MQSIIVNYHLFSDKLNQSQRIVLISDIHDIFTNKKIAKQLIRDINDLKSHHVAIAGDTMQGNKYGNAKKCKQLSYFLDALSEAQKVLCGAKGTGALQLRVRRQRQSEGTGSALGHP